MPYIKQQDKDRLSNGDEPQNAGELNYAFTLAAIHYIEKMGLSYTHINDVLGALTGARDEFYRRVAVPYENRKVITNGDVYPSEMVVEM